MKTTKKSPVRRNKSGRGWYIADSERAYFEDTCSCGLMTGVRFVQNARPMQCEAGYDSTGEAIGALTKGVAEMPQAATRTAHLTYDRKRRRFHVKDQPDRIVKEADFLLLKANGAAIAGWKA